MIFKMLRTKTSKAVAAGTIALATVGMLLLGTTDVSAAALHRIENRRGACLRQFIRGDRTHTVLDELVKDGTITSDQEQAIVDKLVAQATDNGTCAGFGLVRDHSVGNAVADLLKMDRSDIKQAWMDGRSLTEIAQSKGVSRDELVQTIETAINQKLQKAVDGGKITAERMSEIETNLSPIVEKAVDAHRGDRKPAAGATPQAPTMATPSANSASIATI